MSTELLPVWREIKKYLDAGISVIPVRDKDDSHGAAKTPYGKSWKQYQTTRIQEAALFKAMEEYSTTAVALIGGAVSNHLEITDVDEKYKPGITAILLTAIKDLYPEIYVKLRIHKTPSGGAHLLYRCSTPVPGNQKLACRPATEAELLVSKQKSYCFIETRGEGGYVLAPPSLGYKFIKGEEFQVLTTQEHESLMALLRSYNEIIKIDPPPRHSPQENNYYDTNPFEDFNNRVDPVQLATSLGWTVTGHNNQFIWFTRPGKNKGISMSWNRQRLFYYVFTASTELEASKGYTPANFLAAQQFNGDKKQLHRHLVDTGYGRIKPKAEAKIVRMAATNKTELPPNISKEAIELKTQIEDTMARDLPYGIFWTEVQKKGIQIDREALYKVAAGLGFKLHPTGLVKIDHPFIEPADERLFFDTTKNYIREEDPHYYNDILNAYEAFMERHGKFTITRLQMIDDSGVLRDTKDAAFKCYRNGLLKITAEGGTLEPYTASQKLVWKKTIQPRDYTQGTKGRYIDFIKLATDYEQNKDFILSCIGYLAHEYKDETAPYIIVLSEQCEDPKAGGGSGKNVFSELFKYTTTLASTPGEQVNYDERFLQAWTDEKIMCLADVPKNFKFIFLKELSSGGGLQKKLFKDQRIIPSQDMPKFLVQTNYSYEIKDGGLKRRIRGIEFTDIFTRAGGIDVYYGVHFPIGWTAEDWAGFDTMIAKGIQTWLMHNRKIGASELSESGWLKQFAQTYGPVIADFIKDNYDQWIEAVWVSKTEFVKTLDKYYHDSAIQKMYQPSTHKINQAIKEYSDHKGIKIEWDIPHRNEFGIKENYRKFGEEPEEETPF